MRATAFCRDFFEHSVISLQTSVIKTTNLLGCWVQYSRFPAFWVRSSAVGEKQRNYWVTGVRRWLWMAVCLPAAASHLSAAVLRLLRFVSELLLERLSSPPHRRNIKPFCVPKYFRLPVTQSRKSEKRPNQLSGPLPQPSSRCGGHED